MALDVVAALFRIEEFKFLFLLLFLHSLVDHDEHLKEQVDENPLASSYLTAWDKGQQGREQCSITYNDCLMTTAAIERALQ